MAIEADVSQLPLDEQLLAILPGKLQEEWQKIRPEGLIDANIKLRYDGRAWQPQVRIQCQNVSFTHREFPYRLEHGNGLLELKDDRLQMDLTAFSENQLVHIVGEIRNPTSGPTGWLRVKSDELPIDEKLLKALPPRGQSLARSMDLKGTIGFDVRTFPRHPRGADPSASEDPGQPLLAALRSLSLCHLECSRRNGNDRRQLVGPQPGRLQRHEPRDAATARSAHTPQGDELMLRLRAANVPLEGELRDALQPGMRQVWALLQPRGIIDITANVRYLDQSNLLDVTVRAEPRSETCSLEPVQFPLPPRERAGRLHLWQRAT